MPIWEEAATQIKTHFDQHAMSFEDRTLLHGSEAPSHQQEAVLFHRLNWMVIQPSRLLGDRRRRLKSHPTMSGNTFSKTSLLHLASVFSNPINGLGNQPLIFLCMFNSF
jgi:hypothetical protein